MLKNVNLVKIQDMDKEQRISLGLSPDLTKGLIAIETHNSEYNIKAVPIQKGIVNYILNGE